MPSRALAVIVGGLGRQPRSEGTSLIEQLVVFLNAYHLHSADSLLLVLAPQDDTVCCVWPPTSEHQLPAAPCNPPQARSAAASAVQRFAWNAESTPRAGDGDRGHAPPLLSAALAVALCRLQGIRRLHPKIEMRMLVLHAAADCAAEYVPAMNCVFGAQKLGVLIDAVLLAREESLALQHAAHITAAYS